MTITQQAITIGAVVLGTVITRSLPFLVFPAGKETPAFIKYLGRVLPPAVFGMLVIYCLRNGLPLDQDVYDAAEWSCIGSLSAMSLEHNNAPVAVPDFTRGDWQKIDGYEHAMVQK